MRLQVSLFTIISLFVSLNIFSQIGGGIKTKEGYFLGSRNVLIANCLRSMSADESNSTANNICRCRVELLDGRYSSRQIIKYQKQFKDSGINILIAQDTMLKREVENCLNKESYSSFLKLPSAARRFRDSCQASFKRTLEEKYNDANVEKYCACAVDVLKEKRLTEKEFDNLFDVNSLLYNEVNYYCGSPVVSTTSSKWNLGNVNDIQGPLADTIKMIAVDGMQKLKIRIGGITKVAMLDCGATDILISAELMSQLLLDSKIAEDIKFIDIGKYELANGSTIECKRYILSKLYVGKFVLSNIILAATEKPVTILICRTVLNKFRKWNVDNEKNILILEK